MSPNHIFVVVLLTTTFLTVSLISAYHNDTFSHLENTTAPLAPPVAPPLGYALSSHLDNSDNTTASSPLARPLGSDLSSNSDNTTAAPSLAQPLGSALSALSKHLDNTAARSSQSYLGTAVSITILAVGVLILAYFFVLVIFRSPPANAVEEKVEGESKLPEKEEEKKEVQKEEEVHHDEAFWDDVLAKDGRGKAKAVKGKQREERTNRKRSTKWQSDNPENE